MLNTSSLVAAAVVVDGSAAEAAAAASALEPSQFLQPVSPLPLDQAGRVGRLRAAVRWELRAGLQPLAQSHRTAAALATFTPLDCRAAREAAVQRDLAGQETHPLPHHPKATTAALAEVLTTVAAAVAALEVSVGQPVEQAPPVPEVSALHHQLQDQLCTTQAVAAAAATPHRELTQTQMEAAGAAVVAAVHHQPELLLMELPIRAGVVAAARQSQQFRLTGSAAQEARAS